MISRSRVLRFGGSAAVVAVIAAAVTVLTVPTPGNAAPIAVRDTDICVEKCMDRADAEADRCHDMTIQPVGVVWNTSVTQQFGGRPDEAIADCMAKVETGLAACIENCDSRSTPLAGRGGAMRSPYSARRR